MSSEYGTTFTLKELIWLSHQKRWDSSLYEGSDRNSSLHTEELDIFQATTQFSVVYILVLSIIHFQAIQVLSSWFLLISIYYEQSFDKIDLLIAECLSARLLILQCVFSVGGVWF